MITRKVRVLFSALVVGVAASAFGGIPVNPKLPMSFGVDSAGGNRFVGEFKDIELSFGGKTYHSGPAKAEDRVNPFPTAADAEKGMRFKCRFVTKDAAKSQRLLDNATPGKGDGFFIDVYQRNLRVAIGGIDSWSHPVPIRSGRETVVDIDISASNEVTMSVDGDTRKVPGAGRVPGWQSVKRVENKAPHPDATWKIRFREPGAWSLQGWQRRSLSFGNGYFGVSEFGGVDVERLQLTEPTFHTQQKHARRKRKQGNLTDAADLFVEFGHKAATDYVREMDFEDALVTVKYKANGVDYTREMFASYPDKVGAMRFTASKKGALSFTLRAVVPYLDAKLLGREGDPVVKRCKEQLAKYDPVQVGESGQIKEYREERFYGDFVNEKHHRHISHLVGLYPGAIMNRTTPDWLKAASRTLDLRGEVTEAWALLHRMCCRARTGEGDAAVRLFGNLMELKTADTLWSVAHGVHSVDANYAGASAFAELLLQSHELDEKGNFVIDLLPALPSSWAKHGSFRGLCARGGWEVDCEWRDGKPVKVALRPSPNAGPRPFVRFGGKPLKDSYWIEKVSEHHRRMGR